MAAAGEGAPLEELVITTTKNEWKTRDKPLVSITLLDIELGRTPPLPLKLRKLGVSKEEWLSWIEICREAKLSYVFAKRRRLKCCLYLFPLLCVQYYLCTACPLHGLLLLHDLKKKEEAEMAVREKAAGVGDKGPVSYTHLTLPTIRLV